MRWLGAVAACCAVGVSLPTAAAAADPLPYDDPAVAGTVTLCDASGQAVTHGLVATAPFVASAHSDVAAPKELSGQGAKALLFVYQPREGIDPTAWSGRELGAASEYTDPAHPTAVLTAADEGLGSVTSDYPPVWDHLLQLRVYLGAPGQGIDRARYAALDLRISDDGQSWDAVDAGSTSCTTGTAVAETAILGLPTTAPSSAPAGAGRSGGAAAPASGPAAGTVGAVTAGEPTASGAAASATPGGDPASLSRAAAVTSPEAHSSSTSSTGTVVLIVLAALVVAAGGAIAARTKTWSRRR